MLTTPNQKLANFLPCPNSISKLCKMVSVGRRFPITFSLRRLFLLYERHTWATNFLIFFFCPFSNRSFWAYNRVLGYFQTSHASNPFNFPPGSTPYINFLFNPLIHRKSTWVVLHNKLSSPSSTKLIQGFKDCSFLLISDSMLGYIIWSQWAFILSTSDSMLPWVSYSWGSVSMSCVWNQRVRSSQDSILLLILSTRKQ